MALSDYTMPIGDVARVLGVTAERVRQLDEDLQPERVGRFRRYNPADVERVLAKRSRPADEDGKAMPDLDPEAKAALDAACATALEAREEMRDCRRRQRQSFAGAIKSLSKANKLDPRFRQLGQAYDAAFEEIERIEKSRDDEGVIYLQDSELDVAESELEKIGRRVESYFRGLLGKARLNKTLTKRRPPRRVARRPRARRRRTRTKARATADPDPEPSTRAPRSSTGGAA